MAKELPLKEQGEKVLRLLKKQYPHAKMILRYNNNFELLVAVILSARCTDKMVNIVTAKLFPKYRKVTRNSKVKARKYSAKLQTLTPEIYEIVNFAKADKDQLEQDIRSTGFYKNKAKNLRAAARLLLEKFNGELPKTMREILTIPGVARKTANVVLGNAYNIYEGIAVDTHVKRLSGRLGLTTHTNTNKIEQDLMSRFDKNDWFALTYLLIEHGRQICQAKKPKCGECMLSKVCPSAFQFARYKK